MVTFTLSKRVWGFPKLHTKRAIRAIRASMIYVPNACQILFFMYQRANKRANVPKAYQLFNYFSKEFLNFWIFQLCSIFANFKNIWVIPENLSSETKNVNFANFIKESSCLPKAFDVIFNGARGINQPIIRLV